MSYAKVSKWNTPLNTLSKAQIIIKAKPHNEQNKVQGTYYVYQTFISLSQISRMNSLHALGTSHGATNFISVQENYHIYSLGFP
jgi:hypothetical protein